MKTLLLCLLSISLFVITGCNDNQNENAILNKIWYNPADKTFVYLDSDGNEWYQWIEWDTDNNGNRYDIYTWPTAIPDSLPYLYKHTSGRGWEEIGRFKYSRDTLITLRTNYDTIRTSVNLITDFGDTTIAEEYFTYVKKAEKQENTIWIARK